MNSAGCQEDRELIRSDLHPCLHSRRNNCTVCMGFSARASSLTNVPRKPHTLHPKAQALTVHSTTFLGPSTPQVDSLSGSNRIVFIAIPKLKDSPLNYIFTFFLASHDFKFCHGWNVTRHIFRCLTKGTEKPWFGVPLARALPGVEHVRWQGASTRKMTGISSNRHVRTKLDTEIPPANS